jgi:hypothetical protein
MNTSGKIKQKLTLFQKYTYTATELLWNIRMVEPEIIYGDYINSNNLASNDAVVYRPLVK